MKAFDIRDYIWNIYEISDFYKLTNIDLALNMFIENLDLGYERYTGSNLDYATLSTIWNSLPKSYHTHEKAIFNKVVKSSYTELCNAWKSKNKDLFDKICKVRILYGIKKIN